MRLRPTTNASNEHRMRTQRTNGRRNGRDGHGKKTRGRQNGRRDADGRGWDDGRNGKKGKEEMLIGPKWFEVLKED